MSIYDHFNIFIKLDSECIEGYLLQFHQVYFKDFTNTSMVCHDVALKYDGNMYVNKTWKCVREIAAFAHDPSPKK